MKCYGIYQSMIWFVVGGVVMVIGGVLFVFMPGIVDSILAVELPLSSSSLIYPIWQEIPVPIYRKFYIYNYTNAMDYIEDPTTVLNVEQHGPYVYRELREKVFLNWDADGEYVNYRETHTYPFISDLSNGTELDTFMVPNVLMLTINDLLPKPLVPYDTESDDDPDIYEELFVNVAVTPYLWSGYYAGGIEKLQYETLGYEILPGSMFALFYGLNGTDDHEYRINRGTRDLSQQFEIQTWNGTATLPYWLDECNMINGSDGTMYNGKIEIGDRVYIFVSDLCRSIYMDYVEEMSYRGFDGHRFKSDGRLFSDPGANPDNRCFCGPGGDECYAAGLANLKPCKGAPIFLSHPHMLYVDEVVQNQTTGQHPDPDLHRSEVNIEPYSGMMLYIHIRFQINVKLTEWTTKNRKKIYKEQILPVMWIDETATIDDDRIDLLNHDLFLPMNFANAIPIFLMSLGAAASAIGVTCMLSLLLTQKRKDNERKKLEDGDSVY